MGLRDFKIKDYHLEVKDFRIVKVTGFLVD